MRTVRVRTRSIDVNARHNFVMHDDVNLKANVMGEKSLCGQAARPAA